jgi:hypothetical protein
MSNGYYWIQYRDDNQTIMGACKGFLTGSDWIKLAAPALQVTIKAECVTFWTGNDYAMDISMKDKAWFSATETDEETYDYAVKKVENA